MARSQTKAPEKLKIYPVSLGCSKNLVDSERLLGQTLKDLKLTLTTIPEDADVLLVNTCAFIQSATEEAIKTILELAEKRKPGAKIVLLGCLIARYGEKLVRDLPEISLFVAPPDYPKFTNLLATLLDLSAPVAPDNLDQWVRLQSTPPWRTWIRIADGCNHHCTYCLIPKLRGPLVCRPLNNLIKEARELSANGVLEATLIAQDLTAWQDHDHDLLNLVKALADTGLKWIRLMYAYPERLTEKLVKGLAEIPAVVPYLDLPLQHASATILKRMGRRPLQPDLLDKLRQWWPDLALRSTIMVGFPGETEADFIALEDLVKSSAFDHLGIFKFSPEEGAPATNFDGQLTPAIKEKRRRRLMSLQRVQSLAHNKKRLGRMTEILVEGPEPENPMVVTGRAPFQAPEVDGLVYFDGPQPSGGQIVTAQLIKAAPYDLVARIPQ